MARLSYYAVALMFALVPLCAAAQTLDTLLRYGDTAPAVLVLQQLLNASADTQVSGTGPGAPGMETSYFGSKTLAAVKRFQSKHGIITTGFVGPLTLLALNGSVAGATPTPPTSVPAAIPTTTPTTLSSTSQNPALEGYVAAMRQAGVQQGFTTDAINLAEAAIRKQAATTTDYTQQFFDQQRAMYVQKNSFLNTTLRQIAGFFLPQTAYALTGLPFGGYISYVNPLCTCDPAVEQIFVSLPQPTPTSNFVLDYTLGTEAFSWHNLPEPGVATLGEYTPGTQACYFYTGLICTPIPAVGLITPIVGSSATPL